ncbi:50S ribosomal protein L17 [Patescibacteria group bacterium]|nr:50S ribosomal protein L17 [Patescibacteria group bacterium]
MRKHNKGKKFSRKIGHRRALFKSLAKELFLHEKIKTTLPKARVLRPYAEKLITKAKSARPGDIQKLRQVFPYPHIMNKLIKDIAPRFVNRPGGYIRILKLGPRRGDSVEEAIVELVE